MCYRSDTVPWRPFHRSNRIVYPYTLYTSSKKGNHSSPSKLWLPTSSTGCRLPASFAPDPKHAIKLSVPRDTGGLANRRGFEITRTSQRGGSLKLRGELLHPTRNKSRYADAAIMRLKVRGQNTSWYRIPKDIFSTVLPPWPLLLLPSPPWDAPSPVLLLGETWSGSSRHGNRPKC